MEKRVGWETCRLGDIAKIVRGITFPTDAKRHAPSDGYVACLRTANVQIKVEWDDLWYVPRKYVRNAEQYVCNGDVLISTANSFELVGKVAQVNELVCEASLGAFISLFRTEAGIDDSYFFYLVSSESIQRAIRSMASTTTNLSNVSGSKLQELLLPIPPTAEQTRIVEKLEELLSDLDAGMAELKAAQKKLAQYRQSLLKAAVEGRLTEAWRAQHGNTSASEESGAQLLTRILCERRARWEAKQLAKFEAQGKVPANGWKAKYPEPTTLSSNVMPSLPQEWTWATLDQLTEFITSGSRGWADYYAEQGATFIRSQNINRDWLDLSDIAYVNPPENGEGLRTRVRRDDLLLTITGANVGKTAAVAIELHEAYVSQHVALIRPLESRFTHFLHLFLTAVAGGRGQLNKKAYGAGKPGLNLQQVATVFIPLPSAAEISAILEEVNRQFLAASEQEVALANALRQSAAQRKNILQAAFSGQLVPQDPNDEPASVLLARIRAERAVRETSGTRSRLKKKAVA